MGEIKEDEEKEVEMGTDFPANFDLLSNNNKLFNGENLKTFTGYFDDLNNNAIEDDDIFLNNCTQIVRRKVFSLSFNKLNKRKQKGNTLSRQFSKHCRELPKLNGDTAEQEIPNLSSVKLQVAKDLGTKIKAKRDPLPMKLRALPQSFWQQPNQPACVSPAPPPPLAPISSHRDMESHVPQNAPCPNSEAPHSQSSSMVSDANTELLFSLFNIVESEKKPLQKRGRPKKGIPTSGVGAIRDDDPCLVPSGLLPSLGPSRPQPDMPKTLNYSQMLNELVFQL